MIIKTEEKDYCRDMDSMALINTNVSALEQYRLRKQRERKLEEISENMDRLNREFSVIKSMLEVIIKNHDR